MKPWLYLDTARLGQMSPAAQRAQQDFACFAGEVGGAIQFEDLLRHGFGECGSALQRRFPGLSSWQGIAHLKHDVRRLAGLKKDLPVLLAARSAELMKFAAVLLCRPCRNVLVTDLGWPPYHRILEAECRRTQRRVTTVALANDLFSGRMNAEEVVERVCLEFKKAGCDGLFLTAVNNHGARVPVESIANALRSRCRFVVVDAAQDFCHVGVDARPGCCDLYLAGCHKWLGGYHPLGVAIYGRSRSRKMIEAVLDDLLGCWQLDDPLLRFVESLDSSRKCGPGETVNLAALFSCAGAVADASIATTCLETRQANADRVAAAAADAGWRPRLPERNLRSGILLLEPQLRGRSWDADSCRTFFQQAGVALTAYDGGLVRLSMPAEPMTSDELTLLRDAFTAGA